jgi:hypothetical protein
MFASGCSPPRLTATQLPLATQERASPGEGTFIPLIAPAPRRTDSRLRGNDRKTAFPKANLDKTEKPPDHAPAVTGSVKQLEKESTKKNKLWRIDSSFAIIAFFSFYL